MSTCLMPDAPSIVPHQTSAKLMPNGDRQAFKASVQWGYEIPIKTTRPILPLHRGGNGKAMGQLPKHFVNERMRLPLTRRL